MKSFLARMILGKRKECFDFVKLRGKVYKINIEPYIPVEDIIKKAANNIFISVYQKCFRRELRKRGKRNGTN